MSQTAAERFAALYDSYHQRVVDYGRRRVPADAVEDLVADVFLVAWRRIDDAPEGAGALPWLYRIAHNITGNHWRGRDRRLRLVEKLRSTRSRSRVAWSPHDVEVGPEVENVLRAAKTLADIDQEILRLAHWEELPVADIAVVFDISPNTAKQRLRRARRKLQTEYERTTSLEPASEPPGTEGVGS